MPGARTQYLRFGMCRARWLVLMGTFCQGLWIAGVSVYDMLTPLTHLPFLGLRTLGVDMFMPIAVGQAMLLRALFFDREARLFHRRWVAVCWLAGGVALTITLMMLVGRFAERVV